MVCVIRGDETLLRRAVGCLLENAAAFAGNVRRVSVLADEQPQSFADRRESTVSPFR